MAEWTPPSDATTEASTPSWTPPSDTADVPSNKQPAAPERPPNRVNEVVASAASALDFPASMPGFVLGTSANLARTTLDFIEGFATGKPVDPKSAYAHGREVGGQVMDSLTNPMQKLVSLMGMSEEYANAPISQAMSKFSELVQSGGKAVEKATGGRVPSEAIESAVDVGMLAGAKGMYSAGKSVVKSMGEAVKGKSATDYVAAGDKLAPPSDKMKPPTSDKQKSDLMEKIKKEQEARDQQAPLTETAIRNNTTGEIEKMGPKSDEARKAELKDSPEHTEGFVDERGNFLDRTEALDRATRTKQIPVDHTLTAPEDGLHSEDLRNAGDERFKIPKEETKAEAPKAEEPKVDEPKAAESKAMPTKPESEPTVPKTREDLKTHIDDLEYRLYQELDMDRSHAEHTGDNVMLEKVKAEEQQVKQQLEDAYKALPEAPIANKVSPKWAELHDFLWGARTLGQAFDKILDGKIGSPPERLFLKILTNSEFIRGARLEMLSEHINFKTPEGDVGKAAGMYTGGDAHKVTLARNGGIRVLMHEAIHAGTQRILMEPNNPAGASMRSLFNEFKDKYGESTDRDGYVHYGFQDVHEFVSEAFSNGQFIRLLTSIKTGEKTLGGQIKTGVANLWEKFKQTINDALGIPETDKTLFEEVMDRAIPIIEASKDFVPERDKPNAMYSIDKESVTKEQVPVNPRDIRDEKHFTEVATDIFEKTGKDDAIKFMEGYEEYKKTWLEPIKETEKFVGINLREKAANERLIANAAHDMKTAIPDPVRREAISEAIDKGDLSVLSDKERQVAEAYKGRMQEIGDRALKADVIKGTLEDYVTHIINWEGAPPTARVEFINALMGKNAEAGKGPVMGGMTTTSKFGKGRTFKTFEDLQAHLDEANAALAKGGVDYKIQIKTKDLAEVYQTYAASIEKAIANKNLVDNLKQVRNVAGEALIREINKDNPLPQGWNMMDSPQFAGSAVHPDMAPALKFVFDAGPGDLMKAMGAISQLSKRMQVIGSFFHAKSLLEVISSTGIPIWTPAKELVLSGVDKTFGTKFSGLTKAVDQFREGGLGTSVDKWIREAGLVLEVPEDVSTGVLTATGKFADSMIGKFGPKGRVLEKSLSFVERNTLHVFDKFTWDFLHTGGKLMVADAFLDKARREAASSKKPFDEAEQRKQIASHLNDSFGGLNWFDAATQTQNEFAKRMTMAAFNPAGRRALQVLLFAPDWTTSTVRAFGSALPKELNPTKWHPIEGVKGMMNPTTKADYARLYQFKTALTYLTVLNGINMLTANRPIWDNKDPTRLEFNDGTSMQAMKHAMEPYHWLMDPTKTLSNKLGFVPKAAVIALTGNEYASPDAPKLVDRSAFGRAKQIAKGALPFQIQAAEGAPPGEGGKRALLGTLGFPLYGATPEQRKAARAEREKVLKQAAKDYHTKAKQKGWEKE